MGTGIEEERRGRQMMHTIMNTSKTNRAGTIGARGKCGQGLDNWSQGQVWTGILQLEPGANVARDFTIGARGKCG